MIYSENSLDALLDKITAFPSSLPNRKGTKTFEANTLQTTISRLKKLICSYRAEEDVFSDQEVHHQQRKEKISGEFNNSSSSQHEMPNTFDRLICFTERSDDGKFRNSDKVYDLEANMVSCIDSSSKSLSSSRPSSSSPSSPSTNSTHLSHSKHSKHSKRTSPVSSSSSTSSIRHKSFLDHGFDEEKYYAMRWNGYLPLAPMSNSVLAIYTRQRLMERKRRFRGIMISSPNPNLAWEPLQ